MKKLLALLISSYLALGSSPLLASAPYVSLSHTKGAPKKSTEKPRKEITAIPAQEDDQQVVDSGQAVVQSGTAEAEKANGPVYSKLPELTPQQVRSLRLHSEKDEPTVPVRQGKVWTEISRPADPPTVPVTGESPFGKLLNFFTPQAANDFKYQQVTDLSPGNLSEVNEPSVANMGSVVFYTGNWYAARSTDAGQTFSYISPFTTFASVNGGFCCNQVANYVRSHDMMLWALQYSSDGTNNTIRLARAVGSASVAANSWVVYNFTPQNLGFPTGTYLDFPNVTYGSTFLYLTVNVFAGSGSGQDSPGTFVGSVIVRIRLSELAAGGTINYNYYAQSHSSTDVGNLRCTEGASTTMYCASWLTTSQLRIFHWDDSSSSILWNDVNAAAFTSLNRGQGVATGPDGTNFAARADSRILGAWVANGVLGFMWAAKQDATFPYPYVVVGRFDQSTRARISQNAIWNTTNAWLYPTASPNNTGNLAGLMAYGGGTLHPGTNIWISDDVESGFSPLGFHGATVGTNGPTSNKFGDYLTVRPHKDFPNTWVAATYSLKNGGAASNAVPRYLWFGRERDFSASPSPSPTPSPSPSPSPSPPATPNDSIGFSTLNYTVDEGAGSASISVSRYGDSSVTASVDYATSDGTASQKSKYSAASGTLVFSPGQTTQSFSVLITDENYLQGNQSVNLTVTNPVNATLASPSAAVLTITDNDAGTPVSNSLDDARFFVQQHYYDFLSRAPDPSGWDYWTSLITQCNADQNCIRARRNDVSNAFFFELEYQQTGSYVYRVYRAAFGNNQPFPNPDNSNLTEARKQVSYAAFAPDRARVVGGSDLGQAQLSLANAFVQRPAFLAKYPASLTGPQFIAAVLQNIQTANGVDLTAQTSALTTLFNSGGRGAVIYRLADDNVQTNPINNRLFIDAEYNRAFVATEYFGYLRRDADIGGFLFWLGQVNSGPLRDVTKQRAMVCAFTSSAEYQFRFSSVQTRDDSGCAGTPAQITSLSASSAAPMRLLQVNGSGFDAINVTAVRFSNAQGYSVDVPVVGVTAKTLTVHVPPFVNVQTGAYGPGTVSVQAIQTSSGATVASNAISGFQIQDLPVVSSPAGATTLSMLKGALTVGQQLQTEIVGTTLNTAAVNSKLTNQITNLQNLIPKVQDVVQNPSHTFSLGSYKGNPINVGSSDLHNVDRLLVALLLSAAASGQPSLPNPERLLLSPLADPCDAAAAGAYAQSAQQPGSNAEALGPFAVQFTKVNNQVPCQFADAAKTTLQVVAGSAAVGIGLVALVFGGAAISTALVSAGLVYVTIVLAGGMIGLGGALGQSTPGAKKLVQTGVEKFEDLLRPSATGMLGETTETLHSIGEGAHDLYQAIATAPVYPSGFSISPTGVSGVVSCVLNPPTGGSSTFNLFSGNISVIAPVGQAWTATVLTPPESGAIVMVTPSSGTGSRSVSVNVRYPHKICDCPCSLSWNSGSIVRFAPNGGSTSSTLSIAVSTSNCTCSVAPPDFGLCTLAAADGH